MSHAPIPKRRAHAAQFWDSLYLCPDPLTENDHIQCSNTYEAGACFRSQPRPRSKERSLSAPRIGCSLFYVNIFSRTTIKFGVVTHEGGAYLWGSTSPLLIAHIIVSRALSAIAEFLLFNTVM